MTWNLWWRDNEMNLLSFRLDNDPVIVPDHARGICQQALGWILFDVKLRMPKIRQQLSLSLSNLRGWTCEWDACKAMWKHLREVLSVCLRLGINAHMEVAVLKAVPAAKANLPSRRRQEIFQSAFPAFAPTILINRWQKPPVKSSFSHELWKENVFLNLCLNEKITKCILYHGIYSIFFLCFDNVADAKISDMAD